MAARYFVNGESFSRIDFEAAALSGFACCLEGEDLHRLNLTWSRMIEMILGAELGGASAGRT